MRQCTPRCLNGCNKLTVMNCAGFSGKIDFYFIKYFFRTFLLDQSDIAPAPHRQPRVRKKRKLLVDGMMEITNSMMKSQLRDYSDIVLPVDTNYDWLAPPTIRLVQWKEHGTTEPLFKHNFVGDRNKEKQEYLQGLQYAKSDAQPQRNASYRKIPK